MRTNIVALFGRNMTAFLAATFLLLQILCQLLVTVECVCQIPSDYVKYPEDNTAHKIHKKKVTWTEAREQCHDENADLAVATSSKKIKYLQNYVDKLSPTHRRAMWIGIHRPDGEGGDWLRVDTGQPITSSLPWYESYDNDDSNCGAIWPLEKKTIGMIGDDPCDSENPDQHYWFACEISLAVGCPGPVGPKGDQGQKGLKGPRGPEGPPGPPGLDGEDGVDGKVGKDGKNGKDGKDGKNGKNGERGFNGTKGDAGVPGLQGLTGPQGPQGLQGQRGPMGPPGHGYNATWFALLAACQEQGQATTLKYGGESPNDSENYSIVKQKCEELMTKAYEQMRVAFQNPIEPGIQKNLTPKTCRDLFLADPDKPSGEYWIDPNGGDASDKIWVHCDAENRSTCISPAIDKSQVITYDGEEREVWLSEHKMGVQINYTAHDHQIKALQFLSRHAEQNVTYQCLMTCHIYNGELHTQGLKLMGWNGVQLEPSGGPSLRYEMMTIWKNDTDGWRNTVFTYRTTRVVLLPIFDMTLRALGNRNEQAVVKIGDVCFS